MQEEQNLAAHAVIAADYESAPHACAWQAWCSLPCAKPPVRRDSSLCGDE